jgi:hypothetical protein
MTSMQVIVCIACIGAFWGAVMEADTELAIARNHPEYGIMAYFMGASLILSYVILITYALNKVFE